MKRLIEFNDPYQPSEREAMNALKRFDEVVLPQALEKVLPGSTQGMFVSGSAVTFEGDVPVIADEKDTNKIIKVLSNTYKIDVSNISLKDSRMTRVRKEPKDSKVYSSGYIPYKTVNVLTFHVNWKDTKDEDLIKYRDYIRKDMKRQGIMWERYLSESLYNKTKNKTEQFLFDIFVGNRYGTMKWPCIADWNMTSDSIELAFDYRPDKDQKVPHTTRSSVEKRLDNFMQNEFTKLYNKELNTKAWYTITPAGVDDDGSGVVIYSYDINSFNSKRKDS